MDAIDIQSILLDNRQRIDHSDSDGLTASLKQYGTIQCITLEKLSDDHPSFGTHRYRLVAGGRRLSTLKALGHTLLYHGSVYIPSRPGYVLGSELTKTEMHELELEENLRRKQMSWQEELLAIANIHQLKVISEGDRGRKWTQRMLGEMLNISVAKANYALTISAELSNPASPLWKMSGPLEAIQYFDQRKEDEARKILAERQTAIASIQPQWNTDLEAWSHTPTEELPQSIQDDTKRLAREQYLSNPLNNPETFDSYYAEKQSFAERPPVVNLSRRLFYEDCLSFMEKCEMQFDHIITDPPYAIDMGNLAQENVGMVNIESVVNEHQVDENVALLAHFFIRAYKCLKDCGFLIVWCDYSWFSQVQDYAEGSGFKTQRWPIVWVKTHQCMNAAANYNFTKTTEIALVCRKGNASLCRPGPAGHIITGHDEYKKNMDHPFVKPFGVWKHLIEAVSIEGQNIFDPFCGEGSGTLSAIRLNRGFFGCEKSATHYTKLVDNVKEYYLGLNDKTQFV